MTQLEVVDRDNRVIHRMPFDASAFPLTIRLVGTTDAAAAEVADRDARRLTSPTGRALLVGAAAFALFSGYMWMQTFSRSPVPTAIGGGLGFMIVVLVYTAAWAVGGRMATRSAKFARHFVWACVCAVALLLLGVVYGVVLFFVPSPLMYGPASLAWLALVAVAIVGHLGIASSMPAKRRWRIAGIALGSVVALFGLAMYAGWDDFSTKISYVGTVEPFSARVIPAQSPDDFARGLDAVQRDVDKTIAKKR